MVDAAEIDAILSDGGPLFFADPFRDSTRNRQRELLLGSLISLAFALRIIDPSAASGALVKGAAITNAQAVAAALGALLTYGLISYALAVQSDWDVYQHTVLPKRLSAVAVLDALHEELRILADEMNSLPDITAAKPFTPTDVHLAASVQRLQAAGYHGIDHKSIATDIERRATPLLYMLNRSEKLAKARKLIEPQFTYVFGLGSIVMLYIQFFI